MTRTIVAAAVTCATFRCCANAFAQPNDRESTFAWLHQMLLDGVLVCDGLLDRAAVERALARRCPTGAIQGRSVGCRIRKTPYSLLVVQAGRWTRGMLVRLAIRAALVACAASTAAASDPAIPVLPAESLSSKQLSLPADLPDLPCVLIVGFSKASGGPTTDWSRRLQTTLPSDSVAIYSVSVIEDVPRFVRGLVIGSIRRSVPAPLHDRFLLVTQSASAWKELASYSEPDTAYVVLTNAAHEVVWRTAGNPTEDKVAALVRELSAVASRSK